MRTLQNNDKENTNVVFCSFTQENLDTEIGFQIDKVLSIQTIRFIVINSLSLSSAAVAIHLTHVYIIHI